MYDPVTGRWNGMDALTDSVPGWSPYNYGWNNPVKNVDPDGNLAYGPDDWIRNRYGQYLWDANAIDQSTTRENWTYVGKVLPADVGRLDILSEIGGRLYHKNTGNLFASLGNSINSLLGGDANYFVEHKPYDPVTENALMEGAATGGYGGWRPDGQGSNRVAWKIRC